VALALAGAWLGRRSGRAVLALVILAFSPFIALAAQAYGNEGVLRVYLFSLPWTAALAALALAPSPSQSGQPSSKGIRRAVGLAGGRIGLTASALRVPLALGVALILFFPAFFGNDSFNVMPQTEVATLASFQQTAAAGPIFTIEGNDPLSDTARYDQFPVSAIFHTTGPADNKPVPPDIANMIASYALKYTGGKQAAYVVITPSDIAISQAYGLTSLSNINILTGSLALSPDWKLVADQDGTVIYRLSPTARILSNLSPTNPATTPSYPYVPLSGCPSSVIRAGRRPARGGFDGECATTVQARQMRLRAVMIASARPAFLSCRRLMAAPRKPPPDDRQVQKEREPADRSDTHGGAGYGIGEIVPSQADDTDSDYASQRAGCCRDQHLQRPCLSGRRRDENQRDGRGEREHRCGMPARIREDALIRAVNQGLAQAVAQSDRSRNGRCGKHSAIKPPGEQAGNDHDCAQRYRRQ
jgi:hypothetical protein